MPDYFDLDRRLDALVQIAASQSQTMHEMAVSIKDQGRQIQEHGRQIDRIIDAVMGLAKDSNELQRDIESHDQRIQRLEDDKHSDQNGQHE